MAPKNPNPSSSPDEIFLARGGRVHGPFTGADVERMHASGEMQKYSWMWDGGRELWKPLDPPPPPLEKDGTVGKPSRRKGEDAGVLPGYEALCHDQRTAISAVLESVTETVCELRVPTGGGDTPPFSLGSAVTLNLLHPDTGHSLNVAALLQRALRQPDGSWTYQLRWKECPRFAAA
ncbi:MAG: hypothetical protein IT285_11865 [Bdellovibrionales bacterium]|nr:hypothetical protein [Bdellovibrionales bacterium]